MKKYIFILLFLFVSFWSHATSYKNVIFIVPDGTSIPALSLARWYQYYNNPEKPNLYVDQFISGLVTTHSSNAPIGDSAPTMSCYMTGYRSQSGFIGMAPPATPADIEAVDPALAYSPRISVMEAARIEKNKAIGLVFTCEFPHATPAATSSKWYDRKAYDVIASQMTHNNIDVLIGGGYGYLSTENAEYLRGNGYDIFIDDINGFRGNKSPKSWFLFCEGSMPNDMDRDTTLYPSLAEMTHKAISLLSQREEGFFLMVEASKIDWAAHQNDPIGVISEVLAFDKAVEEAVEFAKKDGETLVVILPDHGCGGINIGNSRSDTEYKNLSLEEIFSTLSRCHKTAEGLVSTILKSYESNPAGISHRNIINNIVTQTWGIEASSDELGTLDTLLRRYIESKNASWLDQSIVAAAKIIQTRSYIGFTTHGHTGENVFFAVYSSHTISNPTSFGVISAPLVNTYLQEGVGLTSSLDSLSAYYYAPVHTVFNDQYQISSRPEEKELMITSKKHQIQFKANSNVFLLDGQEHKAKVPAVYVDRNDTWYVSSESLEMARTKLRSFSH